MKKAGIIGVLIAACIIVAAAYLRVTPSITIEPEPDIGTLPGDIKSIEDIEEIKGENDVNEPLFTDDLKADIDSGYLILVNKSNGLDRDYKPDDLTAIKYYASNRGADGRFMREAAANAFHSLVEEALKSDLTVVVTTAYRSYSFQSVLYNNYVAADGPAADRYSARPGKSEHQTGLAADVSSPSVNYELTADFAGTAEGKWLAANAHLFGFIIRYPNGKEEITGYLYEPWHIRYAGLTAAEYIYTRNITLEEYLQLIEEETER